MAYLTIPEGRSFNAGNFYLRDFPFLRPLKPTPKRNVPIYTECKTIHNVVSPTTEAKTCGTFNNGKTL